MVRLLAVALLIATIPAPPLPLTVPDVVMSRAPVLMFCALIPFCPPVTLPDASRTAMDPGVAFDAAVPSATTPPVVLMPSALVPVDVITLLLPKASNVPAVMRMPFAPDAPVEIVALPCALIAPPVWTIPWPTRVVLLVEMLRSRTTEIEPPPMLMPAFMSVVLTVRLFPNVAVL